jgi:hypothetical protein
MQVNIHSFIRQSSTIYMRLLLLLPLSLACCCTGYTVRAHEKIAAQTRKNTHKPKLAYSLQTLVFMSVSLTLYNPVVCHSAVGSTCMQALPVDFA